MYVDKKVDKKLRHKLKKSKACVRAIYENYVDILSLDFDNDKNVWTIIMKELIRLKASEDEVHLFFSQQYHYKYALVEKNYNRFIETDPSPKRIECKKFKSLIMKVSDDVIPSVCTMCKLKNRMVEHKKQVGYDCIFSYNYDYVFTNVFYSWDEIMKHGDSTEDNEGIIIDEDIFRSILDIDSDCEYEDFMIALKGMDMLILNNQGKGEVWVEPDLDSYTQLIKRVFLNTTSIKDRIALDCGY